VPGFWHEQPGFHRWEDWLAKLEEDVLELDLAIIHPHHHLWDRPGNRYLIDDILTDTGSGHNIVATVFVQCRAFHRADGEEAMKPVGETEFVAGVAAMSDSGAYGATRLCEGIVGHADLNLGGEVERLVGDEVRRRDAEPLPRRGREQVEHRSW